MSPSKPEPLILDVRPYFTTQQPPLPAIMNAVHQLTAGQSLRLLAPLEPHPLYDMLRPRGFSHVSELLPDGTWQIDFVPNESADSQD